MKLKHITTKNIISILSDNYCRGVNGKDYEENKSELSAILGQRYEKMHNAEIKKREMEEIEYFNNMEVPF